MENVICCFCGTEHKPIDPAITNQGVGCSTSINNKGEICGCYGSILFDGCVFKIEEDLGFYFGNICDECLKSLLRNEKIVIIKEDSFF